MSEPNATHAAMESSSFSRCLALSLSRRAIATDRRLGPAGKSRPGVAIRCCRLASAARHCSAAGQVACHDTRHVLAGPTASDWSNSHRPSNCYDLISAMDLPDARPSSTNTFALSPPRPWLVPTRSQAVRLFLRRATLHPAAETGSAATPGISGRHVCRLLLGECGPNFRMGPAVHHLPREHCGV